tara:strand:+ start:152 stop:325 length:174 start_codon:yes stop_codon:yes gene_type:complete
MAKIKKPMWCIECGAEYVVIHEKKHIIEYCPMCGADIEEPEEDDEEFEKNFLSDDDE